MSYFLNEYFVVIKEENNFLHMCEVSIFVFKEFRVSSLNFSEVLRIDFMFLINIPQKGRSEFTI